jgi:hypothetical protein
MHGYGVTEPSLIDGDVDCRRAGLGAVKRSMPSASADGASEPNGSPNLSAQAGGADCQVTGAATSLAVLNSGKTLKTSSAYFTFPKGADT